MHVEEFGPVDGTPILFLHGSMVAGWMWMGQVEGLPDHRCLLVDLPGIGRSGDEEWKGFADAADRVASLIVDRAGSAHVVGLSLGGIVGLYTAQRRPEVVRSLLVSGVPYGRVPAPLRAANRAFLWLYERPWGARLVARAFRLPDDDSRQAFLETALTTDAGALRDIANLNENQPIPPGISECEVQTLAVAGENGTQVASAAVPYLAGHMPDAIGATVPGVGHLWNAEQPELFTEMVRTWVDEGRPHPDLSL